MGARIKTTIFYDKPTINEETRNAIQWQILTIDQGSGPLEVCLGYY